MTLESLKALIKEAFQDVEYPGDSNIAGCSRSLTPIGCDDCDVLAAHFKGTTWQQHNAQTLIGCESAPNFLYPEAFHYYLPAFLLAELDDPEFLISGFYDSLEYVFSTNKKSIDLLSTLQRQAVGEYFKYRCTHEGSYHPDVTIVMIFSYLGIE